MLRKIVQAAGGSHARLTKQMGAVPRHCRSSSASTQPTLSDKAFLERLESDYGPFAVPETNSGNPSALPDIIPRENDFDPVEKPKTPFDMTESFSSELSEGEAAEIFAFQKPQRIEKNQQTTQRLESTHQQTETRSSKSEVASSLAAHWRNKNSPDLPGSERGLKEPRDNEGPKFKK